MKVFFRAIKWIFGLMAIFIIVFLAYNIKTIPNYATKRGYEFVWRDDYEKYNQGYCLVEDRILDEEEVYTRGLRQYLDKDKIVSRKMEIAICEDRLSKSMHSIHGCKKGDQFTAIDYYALDKITSSNWYELIHSRLGAKNEKYGYREFFFDEMNATKVDPKKYLTIDMRSMMAGFSRPIIMLKKGGYELWLDKAFILNSDQGYRFSIIYI